MVKNDSSNRDPYDSRVIEVRRTVKVVAGGRNFGFSALVVIGDGKSMVGYAYGKGKEVSAAVQKAIEKAKKNMTGIKLNSACTVQHPIKASSGASTVMILPGRDGSGIIAGGAVRAVFEVLGVKNVVAKCIGSRSPGNVVRATLKGLREMMSPSDVARRRGITVRQVFGRDLQVFSDSNASK